MTILVVVPVLRRPWRVDPVADSLASSVRDVRCRLLFVCSPGDEDEIRAVERRAADDVVVTSMTVDWQPGYADWARKINAAYRASEEPWIFTGADDLLFHPGWVERALDVAKQTGAAVIGTNDLSNTRVIAGEHATHSLVSRQYADELGTIDGPGAVVAEAYAHNFVDDELVATARARGRFAFARDSRVEHLHPNFGKGARDEIYDCGERDFHVDRVVFQNRQLLWSSALRGAH